MAKRGRPKNAKTAATIEKLEAAAERSERAERAWQKRYALERRRGARPRNAQREATRAVAVELSVSERHVRNIRRYYREQVAPHHAALLRIAGSSRVSDLGALFSNARKVLSAEELEALRDVDGVLGERLLRKVVEGDAAKSESRKLRAQNLVLRDTLGISRKRN